MKENKKHITTDILEEPASSYGLTFKSEYEKLKEDIYRPDIEKLQLFTRMLRRNSLLNTAIITHTK